MAEAKNSFLASKMNKDLDDRLIPSNEYKDALNVSVSNSEDSDVGALENILQNTSVFPISTTSNLGYNNGKVIGYAIDNSKDSVYLFWTNYTFDPTSGREDHQAASGNENTNSVIIQYNTKNNTLTKTLVAGRFLNFSTEHLILGANIVENLLFWTDNRNQPRKINLEIASARSAGSVKTTGLYAVGNNYSTGIYNTTNPIPGGVGTGLTVSITATNGGISGVAIVTPGSGYAVGDVVNVSGPGPGIQGQIAITSLENYYLNEDHVSVAKYAPYKPIDLYKDYSGTYKTTMKDVVSEKLPNDTTANPDYNSDYAGDPTYLQDKFVRFSYRFKYDDGEYSIIAPFTQIAFIPKQDGSFIDRYDAGNNLISSDENKTYQSTVVSFMENKVNQISLVINLPSAGNSLEENYKIKEIDILYKESDGVSISVLDTVEVEEIQDLAGASSVYEYSYQSRKPIKTLPQNQTTRVYDKTPVKALAQEVSGNRIIYGNYVNKHTAPAHLKYQVAATQKFSSGSDSNYSYIEYPEHTLKRNRNYQVGFILSDRYGRQSDVILSNVSSNNASNSLFGASTFYFPYRKSGDATTALASIGNSIKIRLNEEIISNKSPLSVDNAASTGEPGLYNATTNPTGWYSYKVVVKQTQQEYYNVYLPGFLNGFLTNTTEQGEISHIALFSDNINKVPRSLIEVGPDQKLYRSDETLFPIVENLLLSGNLNSNEQFYPGEKIYQIPTIGAYDELNNLGAGGADDAIYNSDNNPLIARISTPSALGVTHTHMNPFLSVAETKPFESNLDIYYETSTTGLISELNEAVRANQGSPVQDFDTFTYVHREWQDPSGTGNTTGDNNSRYVTDEFLPTNQGVGDINNSALFSFSVQDGLGNNRTNDFSVEANTVNNIKKYRIKINTDFYYGATGAIEESYIFSIGLVNSADSVTSGINVTVAVNNSVTLPLNDTTGVFITQSVTDQGSNVPAGTTVTGISGNNITISNPVTLGSGTNMFFTAPVTIIEKSGVLQNVTPILSASVYNPATTPPHTFPNYWQISSNYFQATVFNGAFDANKKLQDISYEWDTLQPGFLNGNGSVSFYTSGSSRVMELQSSTGQAFQLSLSNTGKVQLIPPLSIDITENFVLNFTATDAGGASVSVPVNFTYVEPGVVISFYRGSPKYTTKNAACSGSTSGTVDQAYMLKSDFDNNFMVSGGAIEADIQLYEDINRTSNYAPPGGAQYLYYEDNASDAVALEVNVNGILQEESLIGILCDVVP